MAALALVPILLFQWPGASLLRDVGLAERSPAFTELFFPDRSALAIMPSAHEPVTFRFVIRNREHHAVAYPWQATVDVDQTVTVLDHGAVRLADSGNATITAAGLMPALGQRVTIAVTLLDTHQSIDLVLSRGGAG